MFYKILTLLLLALFISACGVSEKSITEGQAVVEYDLLYNLPKEKISFNHDVLPVLESRCVVCHGCYDAPCQLKLSSSEGVYRGANKTSVYDAGRLKPADPTRLFVDAMTTEQWRTKDFNSVLYEKPEAENNSPARNLEQSVLYRMLRLKQLNPQARTGMLSDKFDLSLSRSQSCPTIDEFDAYAVKHAEGGMPFAMPNLSRQEYKTLVHWLAQGAPVEAELPPSKQAQKQIDRWEAFLNGDDNKHQLVSRYLYEHLFQAHLHFENTEQREFYRLVRSYTPAGEAVDIVTTRRPYGEAKGRVYYRLLRHQGSIVAKTHMVYELSAARMLRLQQLFFDIDYEVAELPSYLPAVASNPIKAFAALPLKSRYRFLLDDARFFIEGFIKGPVCRGQVALNVIEDQFWVAFFDPDAPIASNDEAFLEANADNMALPSELEDNFRFLSVNLHYKSLFKDFARQADEKVRDFQAIDIDEAMRFLWRGDGDNKNVTLTIFRHMDSASVNFGWLGDYPETAWFIDYSVLERIHYLLVAGFDVYGNAGHQLNTRLYMDLLRTEAENNFLAFLPVATRQQLRESWYQGIRASNKNDEGNVQWRGKELVKGYRSSAPQRELYQKVESYLGIAGDFINRCEDDKNNCKPATDKTILRVDRAMQKAAKMDGRIIPYLPDIAFVRVRMGGAGSLTGTQDRAYTMIYNKAYKTVSNLMQAEKPAGQRDYSFDSQTILPWLEGVYPNFFYVVDLADIETFVEQYNAISNREEYEAFVMRFGIRRTNEDFWLHADWFNRQYAREQPLLSGIFDFNRYQNR